MIQAMMVVSIVLRDANNTKRHQFQIPIIAIIVIFEWVVLYFCAKQKQSDIKQPAVVLAVVTRGYIRYAFDGLRSEATRREVGQYQRQVAGWNQGQLG